MAFAHRRRLQLCLNTLARELPFLVGRVYTDHFVRDSDLQVGAKPQC